MDDYNISSLHESKNEWGSRLLTIVTPLIIEGIRSIFNEAVDLCKSNNEMDKYLMTFQNFISRIPKWNPNIIDTEKKRIIERSGCGHLEDLITCVHIIQLKLLTAIRVGQKQRKIDVNIPKLDDFIHKIYINVARRVYKNVYLFEIGIPPLQTQRHQRELEINVQECILNTIRESIPVEAILQAYMDETVEENVTEEIKEQVIEEEKKPVASSVVKNEEIAPTIISEIKQTPRLESDDIVVQKSYVEEDEETFPELSNEHAISSTEEVVSQNNFSNLVDVDNLTPIMKKNPYDSDDESGHVKLSIFDQQASLDNLDIHDIDPPPFPELNLNDDLLLDDVEILG